MLSIHQGSPRRLWERITLRTRKAWSFPLQFRRRKQDGTDEKDCIYFARITDLLTGPFPRHAKFLNHPLITLENQHLHGVIRHRLGHVPICDSICIQKRVRPRIRALLFSEVYSQKGNKWPLSSAAFFWSKMQASTNKGSFSLAQQKTDVSHAECGKARDWEMELQTQGKNITSTPQIQWDNSCTLWMYHV